MHSSHISKSSSATSTSTISLGDSQPESVAGEGQQGSFAGISTIIHTPGSACIPAADQQFADLRLLAEVSTSQLHIDPFEALATYQNVTFDDKNDHQQQPDDSLSLSNELSQPANEPSEPVEDTTIGPRTRPRTRAMTRARARASITPKGESLPSINEHFRQALSGIVPEAMLTAVAGYDPQLISGHHKPKPKLKPTDPTDKWIIYNRDNMKPFKCGYKGCCKRFTRKYDVQRHIVKHTGDSPFKCYLGECTGEIAYCRQQELTQHIHVYHTFVKPYECEICTKRFRRKDHLRYHMDHVHALENEPIRSKRKRK